MVHVYINYCGTSEQVTDKPVGLATAYGIIEDTHAKCIEDLNLLLNAFCVRGLHDEIRARMAKGDDYDIVSASTGEVIRKVHIPF